MAIPTILNPVEGHIGPPGHVREPPQEHMLSNGHVCFRVTQTFGSLEGYYKGVAHGAVDIGNYKCGDWLYAPFAGNARTFVDGAGAIGVRIQHSSGWVFEVWHMDRSDIPSDRWIPVGRLQRLGIVGDTGLGAVCHAHLELKKDGKRYDIWQYLAQNREGVVSDIPPNFRHYLQGKIYAGVRIREDPTTAQGSVINDKTYFVQVYGQRDDGEPYVIDNKPGTSYTEIGLGGKRDRWVATPFVKEISPTSAAPPQLSVTTEMTQKIGLASTAIKGAINAIEAALAALREALTRLS